ncbi:MAG TPA: ATP-binding cassette domain-containing protein [Cyclobacteriaceae bacterium]|nr:ATP-binding cassette domain-containing protein [Cyclobacteriaceae bacterium]HPW62101.1 ATP-binding cassette domain-containing protein [Cyclobacteriaceae bacterium]
MLSNDQIYRTLREISLATRHDFNLEDIHHVETNRRLYDESQLNEFERDLTEAGNKIRVLFMEYHLTDAAFKEFMKGEASPVFSFIQSEGKIKPVLLIPQKKVYQQIVIDEQENNRTTVSIDAVNLMHDENGQIHFFAIFNYQSPLSSSSDGTPISPIRRLINLLGTERKEIIYILFYAIVIGFVSLILPLGIQTTVELVSGGVVFSSVYLMIGLVIAGVFLTGALQIVQISLVEFLQRRIFSKAAFEFAYRLPRLRMEAILKNYAPELVNRFFDVMTIQKGLPKLLIDLSSSVVQILFGLLLISLYHPFFVFFGLVLLASLVAIFYSTGPRGLNSSILESKYKYKVAQWLEELARALPSFKIAGNTDLPIRKTDYNVNNYLKYRKTHFSTLVTQFSFIVLFKALITGGLLIMGTLLVIDRKITLGQFVAAEIVIILILNAVEKIIMYMDVVYDLLTAVDKVSHVTDIPIEKTGGMDFARTDARGFGIRTKDLSYRYAENNKYALQNLDIQISPGQIVCISGSGDAGKTTLTNILTGFYTDFEGIATINQHSLRDLDLTHLRDQVAKNISAEDLFDGTLLENLTVGKTNTTVEYVINAIDQVGLSDEINRLPMGLETHVVSGGKGFSHTMVQKLILARCLAKRPKLIVLNDFFTALTKSDKMKLLSCLIREDRTWTLLVISNDPLIMSACENIIVLEGGKIKNEGTFDALLKKGELQDFIH